MYWLPTSVCWTSSPRSSGHPLISTRVPPEAARFSQQAGKGGNIAIPTSDFWWRFSTQDRQISVCVDIFKAGEASYPRTIRTWRNCVWISAFLWCRIQQPVPAKYRLGFLWIDPKPSYQLSAIKPLLMIVIYQGYHLITNTATNIGNVKLRHTCKSTSRKNLRSWNGH